MASLHTTKRSLLRRKLTNFQDTGLCLQMAPFGKGECYLGSMSLFDSSVSSGQPLREWSLENQNPHKGPAEGLVDTMVHIEQSPRNLGPSINPCISKQASSCLKNKCLVLFLQLPSKIQIYCDF